MLRVFALVLTLLSISLVVPNNTFAAYSCEVAFFDPSTRTLSICVGDFDTEAQFRSVEFHAQCKSSGIGDIPLIGTTLNCNAAGASGNLSSIGPGLTSEGKYYGCFGLTNINPNIQELDVYLSFEGDPICEVEGNTSKNSSGELLFNVFNIAGQANIPINPYLNCSSPSVAEGVNTALGCISYSVIGFVKFMLGWSIGVGGGVALVLIGFSGIKMMFSMGDPSQFADAKGMFVAAVSGLLLILFSTLLLRVIGVDILQLF